MTPYQSTRLVNDLLEIVADKFDALSLLLGEELFLCKHGYAAIEEADQEGTLSDEALALVQQWDTGKLYPTYAHAGRDAQDSIDQLDAARQAVGDVLKAQSDLVLERRRQDARGQL